MRSIDERVSVFRSKTDTKPSGIIELRKWISKPDPRLKPIVDQIRREPCKIKRREQKKFLPGITVSGIFSQRDQRHLTEHSGFIAPDFDNCDPDKVKAILEHVPYVCYAGLSVSGRGVWALVPIAEPKQHREHFRALIKDFCALGLEIDTQCGDVARLRFYSYDNDPVWKSAVIYEGLDFAPQKHNPRPPEDNNSEWGKVELLCRAIESTGSDITTPYTAWVAVGGVLVNLFGEHGRGFFHRISQFHPEYIKKLTDQQYNKCLANPKEKLKLGLLMHIAKQHGVYLKTINNLP